MLREISIIFCFYVSHASRRNGTVICINLKSFDVISNLKPEYSEKQFIPMRNFCTVQIEKDMF